MTDVLFLIGRIVLGLFYLYNASNHILNLRAMAGYTRSKGVPMPALATLGTGAMMLVGALSIITGLYPGVGAALLVAFLVPTAFIMHNFWTVSDPQARAMEKIHFGKDLALAASALMFLAIPEPWALSLA
ncbi:MAG: DoxX family protein [Anaerolineae bacterium]|nr:DoxX family protein [Anaerolineae bacterium]